MITGTKPLPREQWPENFQEDPDPNYSGMGTWWCPLCGQGKPE
jgi:hypothetical protein